ncbi:hypothetical protein Tco_0835835 [Tanacetum coccineum]
MSKKVEVIELSDSSDAVSIEKGIEGSSKPSIPPFGSAKRPRTVPKNLIDWYGYVGTWLPEEDYMGYLGEKKWYKGCCNTGKGKEKVQLRVAGAQMAFFLSTSSMLLAGSVEGVVMRL